MFASHELSVVESLCVRSAFHLGGLGEEESPDTLELVLISSKHAQHILQLPGLLKGESARLLRELDPQDRSKVKQSVSQS